MKDMKKHKRRWRERNPERYGGMIWSLSENEIPISKGDTVRKQNSGYLQVDNGKIMANTGYVDIEQGVSAKNSGYEWIIICIIKIQNPKFLQYAPRQFRQLYRSFPHWAVLECQVPKNKECNKASDLTLDRVLAGGGGRWGGVLPTSHGWGVVMQIRWTKTP